VEYIDGTGSVARVRIREPETIVDDLVEELPLNELRVPLLEMGQRNLGVALTFP
jgi:hypothetical protein